MAITHFPTTGTNMMVQTHSPAGRAIMHEITEVIASGPEAMTVQFTDVDGITRTMTLRRDGTRYTDEFGRSYQLA